MGWEPNVVAYLLENHVMWETSTVWQHSTPTAIYRRRLLLNLLLITYPLLRSTV